MKDNHLGQRCSKAWQSSANAATIRRQIIGRSIDLANAAFGYREFEIVCQALLHIPADQRPTPLRVKAAVARLPQPLAAIAQRTLSAIKAGVQRLRADR